MCGLTGLFHPLDPATPDRGILTRMTDLLRHRGPDGEGFHTEPHLGFGHRRLAIVDLAGGAQPMATPDSKIVVTFNGEIYNHAELRTALEALGHVFRTRSDTESILLGWRAWGLGMLDRLDGMFAFALWDRDRGELLLARDRLGEKPLHYARTPGGGWAFASELAPLLALPGVARGMNHAALEDFLALGYVPDPHSMHIGIQRLPPAHALLLQRGRAEPAALYRYWQPPTRAAAAPADAVGEMTRRLDAAVRARLMADVPLGSFLSGGLDSGAVTALAAQTHKGIASFTIGFEGADDESAIAAIVAERHGTEHRTQSATADYLAAARGQAAIFGEPFGDHSAVPTLAVCTLARKHVTVALSGDGGDEVFAGYRRYRFHKLSEGVRRMLPAGVRRQVIGRLAAAYPVMARAPRWLRARNTLTELSLDSALGYYRTVCKLHHDRRRGLYSAGVRTTLDGYDPSDRFTALMAECDPEDSLLQAQYADLHTYLPGDILTKLDRTSMAVSLEVRPPLLAHPMVEWGMALPAHLKLQGGVGKQILRQAMAPLLPQDVLAGPKRGFAQGIAGQFRERAETVRARLGGEAMLDSGLFDAAALHRLVDEHESGRADHAQPIWQLLVLEGFLRGASESAEAEMAQA
jgi:asparagine synthase (glutamine-hydrolysing)